MNKTLITCLLFCSGLASMSQDSLTEKNLDEVIIYSGKFSEHKKYIAQRVDVIGEKQIRETNAQNTGDMLINTGNIFVQKSQQGGSSPVLRGFEASRILLVIDGIRMNNAIYRAGHLQNIITVDQNMLERVEVMYGPASTLYGSDALGGVLLMRTKIPALSSTGSPLFTGSSFLRYSSANKEKTGHIDVSIGRKKIAWLQSYNFGSFGHMKMGSHDPVNYPGFGKRPFYITQINGIDTILKNPDDRVQLYSGYRQWDITQKILFQQNSKVSHLLNVQFSNTNNIPRYDRLQDTRNGTLRYAEWFYGPQQRSLAAYELNITKPGFLDEVKAIASYQHIKESRHTREYKSYDRFDHRRENLGVISITVDGRKRWKQNEITAGIDAQLNRLHSTAQRENLLTGTIGKLDTRYPDGRNNMNYYGIYAQHLLKLNKGKIILNDGLRIQKVSLRSGINDNSFFNFPFTSIRQNNIAITGNLGMIYMPSVHTRLNGTISSGFRAPNIDDLARVFESNSQSLQLIIPNPHIKPEYTYNLDLEIRQKINKTIQLNVSSYYTLLRNAIVLAPSSFNKEDSVFYNGSMSKVYANQNKNKAWLCGISTSLTWAVMNKMEFFATGNYLYGRSKNYNETNTPSDHIPPVHGKVSISYKQSKMQAEAYMLYNSWKRLKNYNLTGEDNLQYATPDGMPAWITLNVKASCKITGSLLLQAGVENILDRNYRYFASGFSAPGRNFMVAISSSF